MLPPLSYFRSISSQLISQWFHLVGGLEHEFYSPFHIWDVILPIDELIFFKMVIQNHQLVENQLISQ